MYITQYPGLTKQYSSRQIEQLVREKRIRINDQTALTHSKVKPADCVYLDEKQVENHKTPVYIAFNKPKGITCTTEEEVADNIIHFINYPERIFTVGRLDKDSEGLILLTNDGEAANRIIHSNNAHEKEYLVTLKKPVPNRFLLSEMASGIQLGREQTKPCKVIQLNPTTLAITLTQGLNRQIRRMCGAVGLEVETLKRVRIMNIKLDELPAGTWRLLTEEEKTLLFEKIK